MTETMPEIAKIDWTPSALRQAGIMESDFSTGTLSIREVAGASFVRMHALTDLAGEASTLIDLPQRTGQCTGGHPAILCLRPREWLFFSETTGPGDLLQHVIGTVDPAQTAVWNQSDALAVFRVSGEASAWLLCKLSGLDFLAGASSGPHCASTRMGQAAVMVHYHQAEGEQFVFDLILDRSLAPYLWDLLRESAPHAGELHATCGYAGVAS
jgi:heterotetrameric sarcosine oxidase gamma subunit